MKTVSKKELGITGVEISLTIQEMIILADLKKEIEENIKANSINKEILCLPKIIVDNMATFLHKIVGDTVGFNDSYEELFKPTEFV